MQVDKCIRNYSYRYLDNKQQVFVISKRMNSSHEKKTSRRVEGLLRQQLFSAPFYQINTQTTTNAILAFMSEDFCEATMHDLPCLDCDKTLITETTRVHLDELKYISNIMKLPMIVLVNAYCDMTDNNEQNELFYHFDKQVDFTSHNYE